MERTFGLIGFPLEHSFSKRYFHKKFKKEGINNTVYENFPLDNIQDFPSLISENRQLCGLNVTIPYKESVIPFLNKVEKEAENIGAVNTIKIIRNSGFVSLVGFNSDIFGFRKSLLDFWDKKKTKALVLGSGGASKAVLFVLQELGIETHIASRKKKGMISYNEIDHGFVEEHKLIINTTPVGMFPHTDECPEISYDAVSEEHFLFDLIYNPEETMFLKIGRKKGAHTQNGLQMLIEQAEQSWKIWNK
jgi:shikimate dehydrogenase